MVRGYKSGSAGCIGNAGDMHNDLCIGESTYTGSSDTSIYAAGEDDMRPCWHKHLCQVPSVNQAWGKWWCRDAFRGW